MNKILINEGGQDVRLDDLKFIETSLADIIHAIASGFSFFLENNEALLLKGTINEAGNTLEISNSFIFWANEIFYCPAQTVVYDGQYPGWNFVPTEVKTESRVMYDGITEKEVYALRTLTVVGVSGYNQIVPEGAFDSGYLIKPENTFLISKQAPWNNGYGLDSGWVTDPNDKYRYRKNPIGYVEIRGRFKRTNTNTEIVTLPVGYRPTFKQRFACFPEMAYTKIGNPVLVVVDTNGKITCSNYHEMGDEYYDFNIDLIMG